MMPSADIDRVVSGLSPGRTAAEPKTGCSRFQEVGEVDELGGWLPLTRFPRPHPVGPAGTAADMIEHSDLHTRQALRCRV